MFLLTPLIIYICSSSSSPNWKASYSVVSLSCVSRKPYLTETRSLLAEWMDTWTHRIPFCVPAVFQANAIATTESGYLPLSTQAPCLIGHTEPEKTAYGTGRQSATAGLPNQTARAGTFCSYKIPSGPLHPVNPRFLEECTEQTIARRHWV